MQKVTRWWPKGFRVWTDAKPPFKLRCQHRKSKTMIDLEVYPPRSAAFYAKCDRIDHAFRTKKSKPGTLGLLIEKYRSSIAFKDLAPRTRCDYQRILDYLKPIADTPLTRFTSPFVVKLMEQAHEQRGDRFGRYVRQILSVLFSWGKERGYVESNPALGIKPLKRKRTQKEVNRPWTDQERAAVLRDAPDHLRPALALMMFTGLGPGDALALQKNDVQDGIIQSDRSKTGTPIYWPIIEPLRIVLDRAPVHQAETLVANSQGRAWTVGGFRASWNKFRIKLEQEGKIEPNLTLYGLRHSVAVILREAGLDDRYIADALSHTNETMARYYSKRASLAPRMKIVADTLAKEMAARGGKVSNRDEKSVKPQWSRPDATGKHELYQEEEWCPEAESNHRHADFQSAALPTELSGLRALNHVVLALE